MFAALGGWKSVGYFLAVLALGASLWWVKGKIDRAYEADRLEHDLKQAKLDKIEAEAKAKLVELDKLALVTSLQKAQDGLNLNIEKAMGRVKVVVKDNPACSLGSDAIGVLNSARANRPVPDAPIIPAAPAEDARPNPEGLAPAK